MCPQLTDEQVSIILKLIQSHPSYILTTSRDENTRQYFALIDNVMYLYISEYYESQGLHCDRLFINGFIANESVG